MKKYIYALYLLPVLFVAFTATMTKAEDGIVVIEDDGGDPDAKVTNVTLVWSRNPEPDIAGYNVYYGRASGDYSRLETVADRTATIGVRGQKTVYFAVTAYNYSGVESGLSEEVHWP